MNKKDFKVITINGLTGLLLVVFAVSFLVSILLVIPLWLITEVWNSYIVEYFGLPSINYFMAALLWVAGALSTYLVTKKFVSVSFQQIDDLQDGDINDIIDQLENCDDLSEEELEKFESIIKEKKKHL